METRTSGSEGGLRKRTGRKTGTAPQPDPYVWQLAENLAESLSKGDRVMVTGRLRQRSWETFLYTLKAGPAGRLRPPSGPATTRRHRETGLALRTRPAMTDT